MKKTGTNQESIRCHLLNNKISLTVVEPWTDYASVVLSIMEALCEEIPKTGRVIILASKRSIENEWLPPLHHDTTLTSMSYAVALGKEDRKKRAFYSGRRIVLTNDEALSWTRGIPISEDDMIVIDELSRYRHFRSERYQAVRRICRKAGRIAAFSRLPFPRGMSEIWEEFYLLDEGKRLGSVKADFLERYFFVKRIWTDGHIKIYTESKENAGKAISRAVGDICLDLTDVGDDTDEKVRNVLVELSKSELSRYRLMARELSMSVGVGHKITASDTSAAAGKLLQMASGTVYDDQKNVVAFHDRKIDALRLLLEEMEGRNVLVAYWYKHELSHILHSVPASRAIADKEDIEDWNAGRIRVGLVNSSMGGMRGDLSAGGNILSSMELAWS